MERLLFTTTLKKEKEIKQQSPSLEVKDFYSKIFKSMNKEIKEAITSWKTFDGRELLKFIL